MCTDKPLEKEQPILVRCQYQTESNHTAQWLRAGAPTPGPQSSTGPASRTGLHSRRWVPGEQLKLLHSLPITHITACILPPVRFVAAYPIYRWHSWKWGWDSMGSFTPFKSSDRPSSLGRLIHEGKSPVPHCVIFHSHCSGTKRNGDVSHYITIIIIMLHSPHKWHEHWISMQEC